MDRREFVAALPRVDPELQRSRPDHSMVGNQLGNLEVAFEICIGHELHVAEARESLAADGISREVVPEVEIHPGQVANRVGVFGACQPPNRNAAGIASVLGSVVGEGIANPACGLAALSLGGRWRTRRRHRVLLKRSGNPLPLLEAVSDGGFAGQALKVDAGVSDGIRVAPVAVLAERLRPLGAVRSSGHEPQHHDQAGHGYIPGIIVVAARLRGGERGRDCGPPQPGFRRNTVCTAWLLQIA